MNHDTRKIIAGHVQLYAEAYLKNNHLNCKFGMAKMAHFFSETQELGITDPGVKLAYVISGVEYAVWLEGGGTEVLELIKKCNMEECYKDLLGRRTWEATKKGIKYALKVFEGSWLIRLKNHILCILGLKKEARPRTFAWYLAEIQKIKDKKVPT